MSVFTKTGHDIAAPADSAGNARSVINQDMQVWMTEVERLFLSFQAGGGILFPNKAAADATLNYPANQMAWVLGDATVANNGVYRKSGASGAGSWIRAGDLPYSFILAADVGAGTPNAIQATSSIPISSSALVMLSIFEANTSTPVTISFNGAPALQVVNAGGEPMKAGDLRPGAVVAGIISGATFRLINYFGSSFVSATNAGGVNAITATTSGPMPSGDGQAIILLPISSTNTATPVTVTFNGDPALTIKTNTGNDIAVGGLVAGMLVMGVISGATFRLINDQVSSAVVAEAEAAAAAAEAAAADAAAAVDAAEAAIAGAVRADITQSLDAPSKTRARTNIGAENAANLTTGTLLDARLPSYTGPYFATVTDCNAVLKGGRYYIPAGTPNSPDGAFDHWMEAISDGFTFVQRVHQRAVPSPTAAPKKFEREYYAGVFGDWKPIVDTKLELDATYLRIASKGYVDLKTDFGVPGVGDDYTNPWGDFLDACLFDSKKGKIPNGTFNVAQPETRTCTAPFQSITIEGAGRQTLLNFRGEIGAAFTFNYQTIFNSFNLSHLNVQTDSSLTSVSAFRLLGPAHPDPAAAEYNLFVDVVFKGVDGYKVANHFATCVYSYRVNNLSFNRCRFFGPGTAVGDGNGRGNLVELQSQNGDYSVKHDFDNCYFSQFNNAILVGPYVQGIVARASDFVGGRCAVLVPAGQLANDGLLVSSCHMNTREVGLEVLATEATSMEVSDTFFIIDKINQVGIRTAGYRWSVVNTHFEGQGTKAGAAGVHAISGARHGIIQGNQYGFLPSGNVLNSGSHDILVVNNRYDNVTTPNVNNGTGNTIGAVTA